MKSDMPARWCRAKKKCGNSHDKVQNRKINKTEITAQQQVKMWRKVFEKWKIHNELVVKNKSGEKKLKN